MNFVRKIIRKIQSESFNRFTKISRSVGESVPYAVLLERYRQYVNQNRNTRYAVSFVEIPKTKEAHKWVGAQSYNEKVYFSPNDAAQILNYDLQNGTVSKNSLLEEGLFKWTGGYIWENQVYFFPRTSNDLISYNPISGNVQRYASKYGYTKEHHYGGVCTKEGVVYQPPRNTDHILAWDLKTHDSRRIQLAPSWMKMSLRYCGSIIHPNGYAYFFPEHNGRVIKLNLKTEQWCLIGPVISTMVFDAAIGTDGNIYGFSAYCAGLLKITVGSDAVEMIHKEIRPGAYGTKPGINGKLYSVPGDGNKLWEYDVEKDLLRSIYSCDIELKAKFAGGAVTKAGQLVYAPAKGDKILTLTPEGKIEIPEVIYNNFFVDCY